jgi:hypothetical protein
MLIFSSRSANLQLDMVCMPSLLSKWRKSSYSVNDGQCVEAATFIRIPERADLGLTVHVRDSRDKDIPALTFQPEIWKTFISMIATGTFIPVTKSPYAASL